MFGQRGTEQARAISWPLERPLQDGRPRRRTRQPPCGESSPKLNAETCGRFHLPETRSGVPGTQCARRVDEYCG